MAKVEVGKDESEALSGADGPKVSFGRNATLMVVGTVLAQGLMLLALPVLTRMYSPEAIGVQAIFVAVSGPLVVLATLRLDLAIVLPKGSVEARALLGLVFYQAVALGSVVGVGLLFWREFLSASIAADASSSSWLWLLIPMLILAAIFQCGMSLATRVSAFRHIVVANLALSVVFVFISFAIGFIRPAEDGLVWARVVAQAAGVATLVALGYVVSRRGNGRLKWSEARRHWRNQRQFLLFNTPYSLIGGLARDLPIFVFAAGLSTGAAASYALARTVTLAPMTLVSSALGRVFYKEAVDRRGTPGLESLARRLTSLGLYVGAPVFACLAVWGDRGFGLVFGPEWTTAGQMAQLLAVPLWLALQTGWPERIFEVTSRQGVSFTIQILFDLLHVVTILAVFLTTGDPLWAVASFAITYTLYQLSYLVAVYYVAGFGVPRLLKKLARALAAYLAVAFALSTGRHFGGTEQSAGLVVSIVVALALSGLAAVTIKRQSNVA